MPDDRLLVLVGTKAQFIKTAPILAELDDQRVAYRLIYTGQHSETFDLLEQAFGTRPADDNMVPGVEASTHLTFVRWTGAFWRAALARLLRREWSGARYGMVHGDTASTLFGAIALRLAGVRVAHVEAGLRSPRLLEPFPEEVVRRIVSRLTSLHFAPDPAAARNLRAVRGRVIETGGNTLRDAFTTVMSRWPEPPARGGGGGYGVVSIHRSENLSHRATFDLLMNEVLQAADLLPLRFVLHPATRERLVATGWDTRLRAHPDVQLLERVDYPDFVRLLVGGRLLMTDGGSNQEEAAMMGLPTVLLRRATERPDGLDDNVVLSGLDPAKIRAFVAAHSAGEWTLRTVSGPSPSRAIVDAIKGQARNLTSR